jgi:hypothetical protein
MCNGQGLLPSRRNYGGNDPAYVGSVHGNLSRPGRVIGKVMALRET